MAVPEISAGKLLDYAKSIFPASKVTHEVINSEYESWRITVGGKDEERWLEIDWGPLSGFGATDIKMMPDEDPDIFAPFDVPLASIEEAKRWLETRR